MSWTDSRSRPRSPTISQTVGTVAQAGLTYTLQVDLGPRKDLPDPGVVMLQVGANTVRFRLQRQAEWLLDRSSSPVRHNLCLLTDGPRRVRII